MFLCERFTIKRMTTFSLNKTQTSLIGTVEISTDGGGQWKSGRLEPHPSPYAWTPWFYDWSSPQKWEYILTVRAIGQLGRTQATQFWG